MPLDLPSFKKSLKSTFTTLNKSQADALAVEIAANYTAGRTAAETHQSIKSAGKKTAANSPAACNTAGNLAAGNLAAASPEDPEEEGLTTEEKAEIALLVALFLGYIKEFNSRAQAQIIDEVTTMTKAGKTTEEIQGYVDDVFSGRTNIIIDNTGQERKELYLDKNLKLSVVTKTVTKPYYASVLTYAALTAANAAHSSYEAGRKASLIAQNYSQWVFVGPADERARPWHVALIGSTFTFGSEQSNYAEQVLREPRCRHRSIPFYGDSRDTKKEVWQKLKDDAGLHWSTENECWELKN